MLLCISLLLLSVVSCSPEEAEIPEYMRAHIAENTTPLETDKFLDYPDFILYTKGDTTVKLSPELQAEVYAEFEAYMQGVKWADYPIMGFYQKSELVSEMKQNGVLRFCYLQRRCFTGTFRGRNHSFMSHYRWGGLTFDEVMLEKGRILFGLDGTYKSVNQSSDDKMDYLGFYAPDSVEHYTNMFTLIEASLVR